MGLAELSRAEETILWSNAAGMCSKCKSILIDTIRLKHKGSIVILLIIILFSSSLKAQNKMEFSAGLGLMELVNLGVYYNFDDSFQSGIKIGSIPDGSSTETFLTFTGVLNYFYTGYSEYTTQKTWYLNSGINYFRDESEKSITNIVFLNIRHGKVFNFSKRFGLKLEAGLGIGLYYNEIEKTSDYWITFTRDNDYKPLRPNIGIDFFYRI